MTGPMRTASGSATELKENDVRAFEKLAKQHTAKELLDMIEAKRCYMEGATGRRYTSFRRSWFTLQKALGLKSHDEVLAAVAKR